MFPEPQRKEDKPPFPSVPPGILRQIADIARSPVVKGETAYGGFSASASYILTLEDGRKVFAKGNHPAEQAHGTQNLRQEIFACENAPAVRAATPRYLGRAWDGDEDGWMLGVWEHIERTASPLPPIIDAVKKFQQDRAEIFKPCREQSYINLFFTPDRKWKRLRDEPQVRAQFLSLFAGGESWLEKNLPVLIALQEKIDKVQGESLLHGDLRLDNIIPARDKIYIVDWPNACRGPAVFDLLFLGADIESRGLGKIEDACPATEDAFIMAASISGFMADMARRAEAVKLPRLRWLQKSAMLALLRFLERASVIESIPGMTNQSG